MAGDSMKAAEYLARIEEAGDRLADAAREFREAAMAYSDETSGQAAYDRMMAANDDVGEAIRVWQTRQWEATKR